MGIICKTPNGEKSNPHTFVREVDEFSRTMEFFSEAELEKQIGHARPWWAASTLLEGVDNGLDSAESAERTPEITVSVEPDRITIRDNGRGIDPLVVQRSLDFATRTTDKAAYVCPTRGRQGNALKTIWAAPFVVGGEGLVTRVRARGTLHSITVRSDFVKGGPVIDYTYEADAELAVDGSIFSIPWPTPAEELTVATEWDYHESGIYDCGEHLAGNMRDARMLLKSFSLFNPHARFTLDQPGKPTLVLQARQSSWSKWNPEAKIPPSWYSDEQFLALIASLLRIDARAERKPRSVREFIAEFRGLSGTKIQKSICEAAGIKPGESLADLFRDGRPDRRRLDKLHKSMRENGKDVAPRALGVFGREVLTEGMQALFECQGLNYAKKEGLADGVPWVLECAFGYNRYGRGRQRTVVCGVNWSPRLRQPFEGLSDVLHECRVMEQHPVSLALHLAFPAASATDRGKSRYDLPDAIKEALKECVQKVTAKWQKVVARSDRRTQQVERAELDELRAGKKADKEAIAEAAYAIMPQAYKLASAGVGMANARQVMYQARDLIIQRSGNTKPWKDSQYFTQKLLPSYMRDNPQETAAWDVLFDERGHFEEPHAETHFGIGTLSVRDYLRQTRQHVQPGGRVDGLTVPHLFPTHGPKNRFKYILFCEKEGFDHLFQRAQLAKRFDLAVMSTKGMTVTAARSLIDHLSGLGVITLVLHDFDKYGLGILHTMRTNNKRYTFKNKPLVHGLGLRLDDVRSLGLESRGEDMVYEGAQRSPRKLLVRYGATDDEVRFLVSGKNEDDQWCGQRVELNAVPAGALVEFVERKLVEIGVAKIVPDAATVAQAYKRAVRIAAVQAATDRTIAQANEQPVDLPVEVLQKLAARMKESPLLPWDSALYEIAKTDSAVGRIASFALGE